MRRRWKRLGQRGLKTSLRWIFPSGPDVGRETLEEEGQSTPLTDAETGEAWSRGLVDSRRASLSLQGDRPSDVVPQFGLCEEARTTSGALEGEKGKRGKDGI